MEVLRRQIADNARRLDSTGKTIVHDNAANAAKPGKASPKELRAVINDRIKGLDPQEPQYRHKAKQLFLESVITWEFGSEIARDQEFSGMLKEIQEQIETTPEVKRQFDNLIKQLIAR